MSSDAAPSREDDAQQEAPEAGAQAGHAVSEAAEALRAREAHSDSEEAQASTPHEDIMDLGSDPSTDFLRQFDVEELLGPMDQGSPPRVLKDPAGTSPIEVARRGSPPNSDAPAAKRSRDNSEHEVLQDSPHDPSTGPDLPYPFVDAMAFKDRVQHDTDIIPANAHRRMVEEIGPRYKLCGLVTLFKYPESYVDPRLVNEPPEGVATVTECEEDETLYPNELIAGAVIGCDPEESEFLTDSTWLAISGLATSGHVGRYKIVGLYTGIDISALKRDPSKSDEEFTSSEIEAVQAQGKWFTKFAALAAQLNIPLTVYIDHSSDNSVDAFDTALHLLKQIPGLSKTHRICLTQFTLFPEAAELFLQHYPNTVFGVTRNMVHHAPGCARTRAWLSRVPWEHLVYESLAPTMIPLRAEDDNHNDSSDCLLQQMASGLADLTGDNSTTITHRMTMAAITHYGLLAANPTLLEGTRTPTMPPSVNRLTLWQYQEYLLSRPGGLAEPQEVPPDVMEGIPIPEMPWYVLQDAPQAPLRETQAGPLTDVPVPDYVAPDLRQQDVFLVNDDTDTSWEYLRRCNDHDRKPGIRYHATIRSVVDDWKKFETDSNATQDMVEYRRKLGNRTINSFGKMHLVCAASRWMRHHATQVAQFVDQVLNTWDRAQLEQITCQFFDTIRTLEVARGDKAFTEGKRDDRVDPESIKFSKSEALMSIRWWSLRCESARVYFVVNSHGSAWYDTDFLTSPGVNAGIRDSFRETLIGSFTDRLDHARLRYFLEEVTKEQEAPRGPHGTLRWPPWVRTYPVDFRRTYWSNKVVLMDSWARTHFGPNLRPDIDAIELDSNPAKALEVVTGLFFGADVEQIILFYGKDALDKGMTRELWRFYPKVVDHLTQTFGRARVFLVTPVFIYYVMKDWKEAVQTAVIENPALQRLAGVVIHPTDLRLQAYFDQHGLEAGWPNEALSLQDRNGTLLKAGVLDRKTRAVETYGLELWTDEGLEPDFMLTEEEILARSLASVGQTIRHFGVPTVQGTEYEERMPKPPKARVATKHAPSGVRPQVPSGHRPNLTHQGSPVTTGGQTPSGSPIKGREPIQPARSGLSLPWEQVKALLQQENAKFEAEWQAKLEAFKAEQRNLLEATTPSSSRSVLPPLGVAPPPASLPNPPVLQRPVKAKPAASRQKGAQASPNLRDLSPASKLAAAEKSLDSTQGRRSEGPHAKRHATTARVAAAASSLAAPPSTTSSTTSATSTPSTTTTSSATTGISAATSGISSGSSASGTAPSSAKPLQPARQPGEGDEAMPDSQ